MKLAFGTQRMPLTNPHDDTSVDFDELCRMVDAYIEGGGRYFDIARPYHGGTAESWFKKAVADRYPRDAFEVTGKFTGWEVEKAGGNEAFFQSQLEACGVDYFDTYMYHALNVERCEQMDELDGWNYVQGLLREGRIRRIGMQFHDGADVLKWVLDRHPEIEIVHQIFNYAGWRSPILELERCYQIITDHNCTLITMYPLMQGVLSDHLPEQAQTVFEAVRPDLTPTSWALRWANQLPAVDYVLVDMSTEEQVKQDIEILSAAEPFNEEEAQAMDEVLTILQDIRAYPCTDCGACEGACPHNLAIGKYIELYNDQKLYGIFPALHKGLLYGTLVREHGIMAECKDCDACIKHCPLNINVPEVMQKATIIFDQKIRRPATPYQRFDIGETDTWTDTGEISRVTVAEY